MMSLRKYSFWLITITIFIGGIVPFAAQFLFPAFFESYIPVGAEVWNQYVSIILGIVATTLSIISLVLCFRSEDRSEQSNSQLQETFEKLKDKVDDIGKHQLVLEERFNQIIPQNDTGDYTVKDTTIPHIPVRKKEYNDESKDI